MSSALETLFARHCKDLGLMDPHREFRFCPLRRWRFDFVWPHAMLAVEVEGGAWIKGRHQTGSGFEADMEKYAAAMDHGYRVLRVSGKMVKSGEAAVRASRLLHLEGYGIEGNCRHDSPQAPSLVQVARAASRPSRRPKGKRRIRP